METELKIVYSIIETVTRQGNDDMEINERIVRAFIQAYRSEMIGEMFARNMEISEECYQYLGYLQFPRADSGIDPNFDFKEYSTIIPKTIRMKNFGIMIERDGVNIPIVDSESYTLGKRHLINKYNPKACWIGNRIKIFIGGKRPECDHADEANMIFDNWGIVPQYSTPWKQIFADVHAILDNPETVSEAYGGQTYDWRVNPFPFPSELVAQIKEDILRKEFNIILQVKNDKVTDGNATPTD